MGNRAVGIIFLLVQAAIQTSSNQSDSGNGSEQNGPPSYSRNLEETLRNKLWQGYSELQRPSEKVTVTLSLNVLTINELDIKQQILSLTGYLTLQWTDGRLAWSEDDDYSSITFLFSSETTTWRPAMIIENSVEDVSIISDKNVPMRIKNDGHITWNPPGIYKVACEADTTYYPMDIQTCTITITPWAYTTNEIALSFDSVPLDLSFYGENGEWELISTSSEIPESRSRGGESFEGLNFILKIRRRPMFHLLNTIFPVVLMAVLTGMVFKLPVDSGEKIGFALTVLLAYAVYLSLISENIPSTSVTVCYLSLYLALILCFGTLSVICTIIVINVDFRSDEEDPMPRYLRLLTIFLGRITCHKPYVCCFEFKPNKVTPDGDENLVIVENFDQIKTTTYSKQEAGYLKQNKGGVELQEANPVEAVVQVQMSTSGAEDEAILTWKDLSVILDKFFFVVFMTGIMLSSVVLIVIILDEWLNVAVTGA